MEGCANYYLEPSPLANIRRLIAQTSRVVIKVNDCSNLYKDLLGNPFLKRQGFRLGLPLFK